MAGERLPVTCPDCGAPVRPASERLCPRCGFPLMFLHPEAGPDANVVARAPGGRDEDQAAPRAVGPVAGEPAAPPRPGDQVCPQCGQHNAATRVRCERCGRQLRAVPPAPPPPPPPPAPPAARSRGYLGPILIAVAVVAAATGVGVWLGSRAGGSGAPAGPPPASAVLTPVDLRTVTASASSTVPGSPAYVVANTLDGDPATGWHSDGKRLPSNVGVRLRYAFDPPVRLGRITMVNGFARSPPDYRNNERVARMRVETGAASITWELPDTAEPQALPLDGASTAVVTLVVEAVYPGTRYQDLVISEVAFDELR